MTVQFQSSIAKGAAQLVTGAGKDKFDDRVLLKFKNALKENGKLSKTEIADLQKWRQGETNQKTIAEIDKLLGGKQTPQDIARDKGKNIIKEHLKNELKLGDNDIDKILKELSTLSIGGKSFFEFISTTGDSQKELLLNVMKNFKDIPKGLKKLITSMETTPLTKKSPDDYRKKAGTALPTIMDKFNSGKPPTIVTKTYNKMFASPNRALDKKEKREIANLKTKSGDPGHEANVKKIEDKYAGKRNEIASKVVNSAEFKNMSPAEQQLLLAMMDADAAANGYDISETTGAARSNAQDNFDALNIAPDISDLIAAEQSSAGVINGSTDDSGNFIKNDFDFSRAEELQDYFDKWTKEDEANLEKSAEKNKTENKKLDEKTVATNTQKKKADAAMILTTIKNKQAIDTLVTMKFQTAVKENIKLAAKLETIIKDENLSHDDKLLQIKDAVKESKETVLKELKKGKEENLKEILDNMKKVVTEKAGRIMDLNKMIQKEPIGDLDIKGSKQLSDKIKALGDNLEAAYSLIHKSNEEEYIGKIQELIKEDQEIDAVFKELITTAEKLVDLLQKTIALNPSDALVKQKDNISNWLKEATKDTSLEKVLMNKEFTFEDIKNAFDANSSTNAKNKLKLILFDQVASKPTRENVQLLMKEAPDLIRLLDKPALIAAANENEEIIDKLKPEQCAELLLSGGLNDAAKAKALDKVIQEGDTETLIKLAESGELKDSDLAKLIDDLKDREGKETLIARGGEIKTQIENMA